ncbi:MAG TPA: ABC transporter ATP-binding protein [Armatimonadetes bacterium]|nr:ABC transporter ATP-binding protein [Armatimonadota bacterium]
MRVRNSNYWKGESSFDDCAVELQHVACVLGDGVLVLRDINLQVRRGEILCVMGVSGSGKSTLLKIIAGLLQPSSGIVRVLGVDITKISEAELNELRKRIGVVFQAGALFDSLTVADNVSFGLREHFDLTEEEIQERVRVLLDAVGLEGTEHLLPAQLSGGMRKRVGIARALAMQPELVLYDEPTSGLDPVIANVINELIVRLRDRFGVTSIVVTHDLQSTFRIADRAAMLYDGCILVCDVPERLSEYSHPVVQQFLQGNPEGPLTEQIDQLV